MNANVLGTRLAELRGDRKWNQAELGRRLGVSRSHISRIESGETKNVSGELLVKIAKLFKVSTDYLLGMTQEPSPMNHDMSELGLSVGAVRQMLSGKLNMEVFNRLVTHPQFPKLLMLMNDYLCGSMAQGVLDRNDLLMKGVAALREIKPKTREQRDELQQTMRYIGNQRMAPSAVEYKAVNVVWCEILKDLKEKWTATAVEHEPVMNLAEAIEGIQAALPDKPRSELSPEDMTRALVTFAQQTIGLTDEAAEHFEKLADHLLDKTTEDADYTGTQKDALAQMPL